MEMMFKIKVASQIHGEKMDYSISDDIKHFFRQTLHLQQNKFQLYQRFKYKKEKHKNTKTEMGDEEDLAMTQNLEATK